ncbi:hypothetical protein [Streptomyces asiaticus]|uniref:hypothetical protein n=1 Tax=Streptomyces asiaticus TaxID=114695 RepID=UPI00117D76EB
MAAAGGDPQVGDGVREHHDGRGGAARASGATRSAGAAVHAVVADTGRAGGAVRTRGTGRAAAVQRAAVAAVGLGDHDEGVAREPGEDVLGVVDHLARDQRQPRLGRQLCELGPDLGEQCVIDLDGVPDMDPVDRDLPTRGHRHRGTPPFRAA